MNDFFDLIATFFAELTNEEKILLGILSLLTFSLGVIIGWIMQSLKTRRYRKELLLLRKDRDEYEVRYRATETKQKALAKELELISREKVEALDRIQALEATITQRDAGLLQLRREQEELQATNQSYAATIDALNDQVIGLKTQNEQLLENNLVPRGEIGSPANNQGAAAGAGQDTSDNESLNAYILQSETRFQSLEQRLMALVEENNTLRSSNSSGGSSNPGYTTHRPVVSPLESGFTSAEPLVIRADTAQPGARTGGQGDTSVIVQTTPSIQVPNIKDLRENHQDDLTRIKNIGPFLQTKLNEADIYRYEQIATWTEADIVTYTGLIGYLPGIIQRDDWVGQAAQLLENDEAHQRYNSDREAIYPPAEDNLRIVEGIGPKIEAVLKEAGIESLSQLAETPTDTLRDILEAAGSSYKSHDPKTWPVQAGLAADGKLEELEAWQQELKGGK